MTKPSPFRRLTAPATAFTLLIAALAPTVSWAQEAKPPASAASTQAAVGKSETAKPEGDKGTKTAPKPEAAGTEKAAPEGGETGTSEAAGEATQDAGDDTIIEGEEPTPAGPTEEERETARQAFESGMTLYEEGKYLQAAGQFKKALEAIPSPHAEYWIALSMDKSDPEDKHPQSTAEAYVKFLNNPGAQHVGEDQVALAQQRLEELRKLLPASLTVITTPDGASVSLNGEKLEGVTPLTVERSPGTYTLLVEKEGHQAMQLEVKLEGGVELEQEVGLQKTPPPPEPTEAPAAEPEERSMVPAYVTLGLGGVGLITGTVFGILALDSKGKYDDNPSASLADDVERSALIADMSFGIALTLGVTGVVLLTAKDPAANGGADSAKANKPKAGQLVVAPYGSPYGGGARAQMRF